MAEWFDRLFRRTPKNTKWAPTFNSYAPIFSQFGTNIYASDVVQQALKCIVDEMKKLNPTHVRYNGADPVPVKSSVQDVLDNPNPLMTTSGSLACIASQTMLMGIPVSLHELHPGQSAVIAEASNRGVTVGLKYGTILLPPF